MCDDFWLQNKAWSFICPKVGHYTTRPTFLYKICNRLILWEGLFFFYGFSLTELPNMLFFIENHDQWNILWVCREHIPTILGIICKSSSKKKAWYLDCVKGVHWSPNKIIACFMENYTSMYGFKMKSTIYFKYFYKSNEPIYNVISRLSAVSHL